MSILLGKSREKQQPTKVQEGSDLDFIFLRGIPFTGNKRYNFKCCTCNKNIERLSDQVKFESELECKCKLIFFCEFCYSIKKISEWNENHIYHVSDEPINTHKNRKLQIFKFREFSGKKYQLIR